MNLTFAPLAEPHFPFLLKWLETPHVKKWWDQDIAYDINLVKEKFGAHAYGKPINNAPNKLTYAYIIQADNQPIGYIQAYNALSYAEENEIKAKLLPEFTAGIDLFIGEEDFLNRGLGDLIVNTFCKQVLSPHFNACLVDPVSNNTHAIKAFAKAGFKVMPEIQTDKVTWMLKELKSTSREQDKAKQFKQLEMSLLEPKVRSSVSHLNKLIDDDFIEFSSSGKVYDKQDILKFLPAEEKRNFVISDFAIKELSEDVVLVTYKTTENGLTCLRSSLWKREFDEWKMVFHQGTKMLRGEDEANLIKEKI